MSQTAHLDDRTNYLQRFGDWSPILNGDELEKGVASKSQLFYHGQDVAKRMSAVRESIAYVRSNWKSYNMLMGGLRRLLEKRLGDSLPAAEDLHRLLSNVKEWGDRRTDPESVADDFSAIRLYASNFGYREVFKLVDDILRTDARDAQHEEERNAAVFLEELLNIDLFNYVALTPKANNFRGTVFRALAASKEELQSFEELAAKPIAERFWAVPLILVSATSDPEAAITFAKMEVERQAKKRVFLWRIHVVELEAELLQIYQEKFPSSVVSTICAVPIHELSPFPEEHEVLLRGPFFQLVRMQEEMTLGLQTVHVMDCVTLSTNRDHPSTMELGETEGNRARDLIACLVGIGRVKACKKLAEDYGMMDDAQIYQQLLNERLKSLEIL
ncbi:hypothetical protein H0H92_015564 [Tricholoma furcatifolium]|nr:hypothetical protein H0H92_015564 [Tricholoma furcatifolium]